MSGPVVMIEGGRKPLRSYAEVVLEESHDEVGMDQECWDLWVAPMPFAVPS